MGVSKNEILEFGEDTQPSKTLTHTEYIDSVTRSSGVEAGLPDIRTLNKVLQQLSKAVSGTMEFLSSNHTSGATDDHTVKDISDIWEDVLTKMISQLSRNGWSTGSELTTEVEFLEPNRCG